MTEDEETFSRNSFHAKYLNPGIHSQFLATLQNQPQGGSCAVRGLCRPENCHTKSEVLQKTKSSSLLALVVLACLLDPGDAMFFVRRISFHALP